MSSTPSPSQNHLLAALPAAEFDALAVHLEWVAMPLGKILYGPGEKLQHAYFPTTSIVSLHYVMASGATAETAGVGNEGVVGVSLFLGGETTLKHGRGADRRPRLPAGGASAEGSIQSRRLDAAFVAALHPGTADADRADSGLQPASFTGAAVVPLAVADARSHADE